MIDGSSDHKYMWLIPTFLPFHYFFSLSLLSLLFPYFFSGSLLLTTFYKLSMLYWVICRNVTVSRDWVSTLAAIVTSVKIVKSDGSDFDAQCNREQNALLLSDSTLFSPNYPVLFRCYHPYFIPIFCKGSITGLIQINNITYINL